MLSSGGEDVDQYAVNNGDGTVVEAEYPQASLFLNTPSESDYDSSLPVGVLVLDGGLARTKLNARVGSSTTSPHRDPTIHGDLTIVNSDCSAVWTGTPHNTDQAYVQVCWSFYKPTNGDGDPDKNYRVVFSVGALRGGDGNHVIEQGTTRNQVTQGNICCDWDPSGCCDNPSGPVTLTRTVSANAIIVGSSVTSDFVSYPDSDGQRFFDLAQDKHNYGWRGDKQCCQIFGSDGGLDLSYNQGGSWQTSSVPFIQWHN